MIEVVDLDEKKKEQCPVPVSDRQRLFDAFDKAEKAFTEFEAKMELLRKEFHAFQED